MGNFEIGFCMRGKGMAKISCETYLETEPSLSPQQLKGLRVVWKLLLVFRKRILLPQEYCLVHSSTKRTEIWM